MPDDADYSWLAQLLERPDTWSESDLEAAERMVETQRRAVEESDPRDAATRQRLEEVLTLLEEAVRAHRARGERPG